MKKYCNCVKGIVMTDTGIILPSVIAVFAISNTSEGEKFTYQDLSPSGHLEILKKYGKYYSFSNSEMLDDISEGEIRYIFRYELKYEQIK